MPNGTRCSVCHKVFGLFRREHGCNGCGCFLCSSCGVPDGKKMKCARCVAAQGRAVPIGSRNNDQGDATNKRRTLMTTLIYADESQHAGGNASAGASTDVTAAVDNAATRSSVRGAALPLQQTAADRCQGRLMTSLFYADESAPPAPQATVSPPADEEHRPSPQHLQQQLGLSNGANGRRTAPMEQTRSTVSSMAERLRRNRRHTQQPQQPSKHQSHHIRPHHVRLPTAAATAAAGLVGGGNGNVNGAASAHEAAAPTRTLQQAPVPPTDDLLRRLRALQGTDLPNDDGSGIASHTLAPKPAPHTIPRPPTNTLGAIQTAQAAAAAVASAVAAATPAESAVAPLAAAAGAEVPTSGATTAGPNLAASVSEPPSLAEIAARSRALRPGGSGGRDDDLSLDEIAARTKALRTAANHEEVSDAELLRRLGALTGKTTQVVAYFGNAANVPITDSSRGMGPAAPADDAVTALFLATDSAAGSGNGTRGPDDEVAELLEQAMTEVQLSNRDSGRALFNREGGGGNGAVGGGGGGGGGGSSAVGVASSLRAAVCATMEGVEMDGIMTEEQQAALLSQANAAVAAAHTELAAVQRNDYGGAEINDNCNGNINGNINGIANENGNGGHNDGVQAPAAQPLAGTLFAEGPLAPRVHPAAVDHAGPTTQPLLPSLHAVPAMHFLGEDSSVSNDGGGDSGGGILGDEEAKILEQVMLELELEKQMEASGAAVSQPSPGGAAAAAGAGTRDGVGATEGVHSAAAGGLDLKTPHLAPPSAILTTWAELTKDRSEELPWCSICEEDAVVRCTTCIDEPLFCKRCCKREHKGLSGHTTVQFKDEFDSDSDNY